MLTLNITYNTTSHLLIILCNILNVMCNTSPTLPFNIMCNILNIIFIMCNTSPNHYYYHSCIRFQLLPNCFHRLNTLSCLYTYILCSDHTITMLLPCSYHAPTVLLPCSYRAPTVLLPCSYRAPTVLLPCSYRALTALIPRSYRAPTALLPRSYRAPTVLLRCYYCAITVLLPCSALKVSAGSSGWPPSVSAAPDPQPAWASEHRAQTTGQPVTSHT